MSCAANETGESMDDLRSEILLAFSRRLQGLNPFDPNRGNLQKYLRVLCDSYIRDAKKKNRRRYRRTKDYCEAMSLAA